MEKILYPTSNIQTFIKWFYPPCKELCSQRGWKITEGNWDSVKTKYQSVRDTFYRVEPIADPEEGEALNGVISEEKVNILVKKAGLMVDELGVIYGWEGKSFLDTPEKKGWTFIAPRVSIISSSSGTFVITSPHGRILEMNLTQSEDAKSYREIERFDIAEFNDWYFRRYGLQANLDHLDILALGYWLTDGTYEPPAHDWREEVWSPLEEEGQLIRHN